MPAKFIFTTTLFLYITLMIIHLQLLTSQYMYPFYGPSYPSVPMASSPTFLPTAGRSRLGFISDIPYDPGDSFTNYDWEPPNNDNNTNSTDHNGNPVPHYTYDPTTGTNSPLTTGHSSSNNHVRIPIRPHDYYAVYMDQDEDHFDGIPNARWNRRPTTAQPHNILLNSDSVVMPRGSDPSTNVPIGRQYGFHNSPSYLRNRSSYENYHRGTPTSNDERYADVYFMDIIRSRSYFTPPHFPGLQ